MTDNKFPKGLFANKPHEKAPDFIKANLNIKRDEFIEWLKTQPEKVNIDVKENKGGKWYAQVNEWVKPEESKSAETETDLPF